MKGQYAMEYMVIIALVLLVLIPTLWFAFNRSSETAIAEQASSSVNVIASAADEVYYLGPGNKNTVSVNIPPSVISFNITTNEVMLKIRVNNLASDFFALTKGNLSGANISSLRSGIHYVTVEHLNSGRVNISMTP